MNKNMYYLKTYNKIFTCPSYQTSYKFLKSSSSSYILYNRNISGITIKKFNGRNGFQIIFKKIPNLHQWSAKPQRPHRQVQISSEFSI